MKQLAAVLQEPVCVLLNAVARANDGCVIRDGRNWTCPAHEDAKRTITLSLEHGLALHDGTGRTQPFHAVDKWRWLLLRWGLPAGSSADY